MPELPEVELHRRHLEGWLTGRKVINVALKPAGLLAGTSAAALHNKLVGARFERPMRKGKHLFIPVEGGGGLYVHLGMTGHLSRRDSDAPLPRFMSLALVLDDGKAVDLTDARRFSKLGWITGSPLEAKPFSELGDDLLLEPPQPKRLVEMLARSKKPIKLALMDQDRIAGLGNLHAAEALWRAHIHPERAANTLDVAEARALLKGIRATFDLVLESDAGEDFEYAEEDGDNPFKVYSREDEPCPRCKTRIKKIAQGGRSTYFCPKCQPEQK